MIVKYKKVNSDGDRQLDPSLLEDGKSYCVMGINVYDGIVNYLVILNDGHFFYPHSVKNLHFDIVENEFNFETKILEKESGIEILPKVIPDGFFERYYFFIENQDLLRMENDASFMVMEKEQELFYEFLNTIGINDII